MYIDGFAVAERLRKEHPEAFDFFSRTSLSYQCFDEGCHYMAEGPVFRLGALGRVVQVRAKPLLDCRARTNLVRTTNSLDVFLARLAFFYFASRLPAAAKLEYLLPGTVKAMRTLDNRCSFVSLHFSPSFKNSFAFPVFLRGISRAC